MITDVNTTVIGPVGSEIRVGVPPNSDATRPMITAPQRPAAAPAPEAMPKANAMGKGDHGSCESAEHIPLQVCGVDAVQHDPAQRQGL
jgi:hypothetical protein